MLHLDKLIIHKERETRDCRVCFRQYQVSVDSAVRSSSRRTYLEDKIHCCYNVSHNSQWCVLIFSCRDFHADHGGGAFI